MSLAITHFAVGAALTTLVVWALGSLEFRFTIAVAGGIWALVPDFHYVLPPVFAQPLFGIEHTPLGDLFWFHGTLDGLVQGRGTRTGAAVALAFLLTVVAFTEWYATRETNGAQETVCDGRNTRLD